MQFSNLVFLYVEYAGHAVEIMLTMNLLDVDGIVICSGDGLVYEVLQYFLVYPKKVLLVKIIF